VSTQAQENEGASLAAQERRYRELAALSGWVTVAELKGQESATKAAGERLVLQRLLSLLRLEPVDAIWVYEQSRLTRADELEVALLKRELRERQVQRWRIQSNGPEYRCEAGISYPIRWLWEWRERGRQRMTAQKKTRGR
jgi:hypothetical protein